VLLLEGTAASKENTGEQALVAQGMAHIVLLSTYYTLRGIRVFLLIVGNGSFSQFWPKMPKMESDLKPYPNAPVLQDVKHLMIQ
jgi:hypothetical protein